MKVFLGGTCNESKWRDNLILDFKDNQINYFNPVVKDWTYECQQREKQERQNCDICLYTITPKMTGVYSIAEVVDDSNKRPNKTVLVLLKTDEDLKFTKGQWRSLLSVADMVTKNGGVVLDDLKQVVNHIIGNPTYDYENTECICTNNGLESEWIWDNYEKMWICSGCGQTQ